MPLRSTRPGLLLLSAVLAGALVGATSARAHPPQAPRASALAPSATGSRDPVAGFDQSPGGLWSVPVGQRPYDAGYVTVIGSYGPVDSRGVRIFRMKGSSVDWQHPVAQAQYGLAMLNSYRLTKDPKHLALAVSNAQRLVDRRVESGRGWYFPYDFDYNVLGDSTVPLKAPWFSGMAQGQALSLFTRLYTTTRDPRWRTAADRALASLTQAPSGALPFGAWVDQRRRLWLEEYPRYPFTASEKVLNGHIFAIYGLYDYWEAMGHPPTVMPFLRGALRTVETTAMTQFRRPGWASVYSLYHGTPSYTYHPVHIEQMLRLWAMTRNPYWVTTAATFRADFPTQAVRGTVRLTPRTTRVYALGADAKITQRRPVVIRRETEAPFDARWRSNGGPVMLRISAGWLAGTWVEEKPGAAWAKGATDLHSYAPPVRLRLGTTRAVTGHALDAAGTVTGSRRVAVRLGSAVPVDRSGWVLGRQAYRVSSGALAGLWVPAAPDLTVTGPWS